jgi:alpha-tubulin suppressor-like RCC1 family protein
VEPTPLPGGHRFIQLSAGFGNACGVTPTGDIYCWGDNRYGQLGSGSTGASATPQKVLAGFQATSVSAGSFRTCALATTGEAYCWGGRGLGDGTRDDSTLPVRVAGGHRFRALDTGDDATCGITLEGPTLCWGGFVPEIGLTRGTLQQEVLAPLPLAGDPLFQSLSVGRWVSCGITLSREAYCWGQNYLGQLGVGDRNDRAQPTKVLGQP